MKGRFGTPLWVIPVLAMVMALGAFAVFAGINHFSTPVEADISPATNIPIAISDRGLNQTATHTVGPFSTSIALDGDGSGGTEHSLRLVYPAGYTLPTTGVTVNGVAAEAVALTGTTLDINLGDGQDIAAGADVTVVIPGVTNTGTFGSATVTVSDQAVGAEGTPIGQTAGATATIPLVNLNQSVPSQASSNTSGRANPDTAGRIAEYRFEFITSQTLAANTGEVKITWDKDIGLPDNIGRGNVLFQADVLTNPLGAGGVGTGGADQVVPMTQDPTFDVLQTDPRRRQTILKVPDMDQSTGTGGGIGVQGIAAGARVVVTFTTGAGIRNEQEGGPAADGSAFTSGISLEACTSACNSALDGPGAGDNVISSPGNANVETKNKIFINDIDGARGATLVINGVGYVDGKSVTVFLDNGTGANPANDPTRGNGLRDPGERDLGTVVVADDLTFTLTVTVSNPPFAPQNTAVPGRFNIINAVGGEGEHSEAGVNDATYELEPTIRISPEVANIGDRITVSLFDYPPGESITQILIGGNAVNLAGPPAQPCNNQNIAANGEANCTFIVPTAAGGQRISRGVQRFDVNTASAGNDTDLTIGLANLSISHETVIANQDLTISGDGFTEGGGRCILQGGITISNVPVIIDDDSVDANCANFNVQGDRGVELTSGGTFTATVRIIETNNQIPSSLLTAGTHELKVIDTDGAEGTLDVTIPGRELEITPAAARPRDIITIIGRNFPADNPDTGSVPVTVEYSCGGANTRTTTADPDASGNFRDTMRIPTNCAIPSTNTVSATIGTTNTVDTRTHEIPNALVRVEPVRGQSGNQVTVAGEGFRTFETVEAIEFGGRGTLGGRTVNTDANGNFSVPDIVVPGLDPGVHAVIVRVGSVANRVTASTSFEILEAGFAGAQTFDSQVVFGGVPTLERAWLFDNTDKEWQFFTNDPELTEQSDLLEVPSGAPIWILVTENTDVELNNQPFNLTCVNPGTPEEDCWNLIVFP